MSQVIYQHRQSGKVILLTLFVAIVLVGYLAISTESHEITRVNLLICGVAAFFIWLFGSLNVVITEMELMVAFGPGWIKRRIPISSIISVKSVQNSWIMGWGIRIIPNGVMFNVSGLAAVQLELRSGSVFRVGTNEPEKLEATLREVIQGGYRIRQ